MNGATTSTICFNTDVGTESADDGLSGSRRIALITSSVVSGRTMLDRTWRPCQQKRLKTWMSTAEISSQISINPVTVNATFIARQHIIAIRKATLIIAISSVCRSLRLSRASIASEVLRNQSSNQCYTPLRGSFSNAKDLEQITLGHPNGAPN